MTLAIISAPGSRGDVNPMVAIGKHLRRLGFEVVISLAESYAEVARAADLQVEPIIDHAGFQNVLSRPHLWKPIRGARTIFREVAADFLPRHDQVIRKHHRPGQTILVSHPLDFASRVFRELDPQTPLFDVHLAPAILRTDPCPPRLSPWWFEVSSPAWAVRASYWFADRLGVDPLVCPPLNRLRKQYGLPPVRRVLDRWWLSPDRILAMYPDWFAPATEQYKPRLTHVGFPLDDGDDRPFELPPDRPMVFTAGTAHLRCRQFFHTASRACVQLNQPGLLVSSHPENFPADLPPLVQTASYVSFAQLLPHCRLIVHHGGIGTTSQALAAGIPQVVRPMAFDQFDNASRVERLECGLWLRRERDLTRMLGGLLDDDQVRQNCAAVAARLQHVSGAAVAAEEIRRSATADENT